jgi:hypothetical protein
MHSGNSTRDVVQVFEKSNKESKTDQVSRKPDGASLTTALSSSFLSALKALEECKTHLTVWDQINEANNVTIKSKGLDPYAEQNIKGIQIFDLNIIYNWAKKLGGMLGNSDPYKHFGRALLRRYLDNSRLFYKKFAVSYKTECELVEAFNLGQEGYRAIFLDACKKTTNVEDMEVANQFTQLMQFLMRFLNPTPADYCILLHTYMQQAQHHRAVQDVRNDVIALLKDHLETFSSEQIVTLINGCLEIAKSSHICRHPDLWVGWYDILITLVQALPAEMANIQLKCLSNATVVTVDSYTRPFNALQDACAIRLKSPDDNAISEEITRLCNEVTQHFMITHIPGDRSKCINYYFKAYVLARLANMDNKVVPQLVSHAQDLSGFSTDSFPLESIQTTLVKFQAEVFDLNAALESIRKKTFILGFLKDSKDPNGQKNKSSIKSLRASSMFENKIVREIFTYLAQQPPDSKVTNTRR